MPIKSANPLTFQDMILKLSQFWAERGCVLMQPYDMEMGAGTFHPATFLKAIGPEPWYAAYVQPSRRPTDGRYGENPNRLGKYYQFQVILKPSPLDIQQWYLDSLIALGINPLVDDIRFVEDNWKSPTLGAWGMGWEVWQNGMEISQYTYFQQVGGIPCEPVTGELTYGCERLAMYLQNVDNVYDLVWCHGPFGPVTYGEIAQRDEFEYSSYCFEHADVSDLLSAFKAAQSHCDDLLAKDCVLPAYEAVLRASHGFNLLDARKAISVTERQAYLLRIRKMAEAVAHAYLAQRERLGFPLLTKA